MSTPKEIVEASFDKRENNSFSTDRRPWCPYSKKAKELFKTQYPDTEVTVFELDERDDGDEIQSYLLEKTGQRTVPNVFIKQNHIGGSDVLAKRQGNGELARLLN
ncbi:thioredoxin-like protein [Lactarius quietus]|nr:thioredoxin-like protein [Lactarius quietus]